MGEAKYLGQGLFSAMQLHATFRDRWNCSTLGLAALVLFAACRSQTLAVSPVRHTSKDVKLSTSEELQPAIAYCMTHPPDTKDIAFVLDYDGSDGAREPWFSASAPPLVAETEDSAGSAKYSQGAGALCKASERPEGRRYLLNVPVNAEPRKLDEYVRLAARRGYDRPIFKAKNAIVAAQIASIDYGYSPTTAPELGPTIGTVTVEANAEGNYELRARVTDGYELSEPVGLVTVPRVPDLADCESKTADAVRQLCSHPIKPCERITLVGVNDIGSLLTVLAYIEAVSGVAMPMVEFGQRNQGLDVSPYIDSTFRRAFRVSRFFGAMKPETVHRKIGAAESLARRKLGLYAPLPSSLTAATEIASEAIRRLTTGEWVEVGKTKTCDSPGRAAATLVVDQNDKVRAYSEHVIVTDRAEVLLRAYYDDAQRLRLVTNSETTDAGESWDAYLLLGEDGCPKLERISTKVQLSANMLHWELKSLLDPRGAYGEPLCIGGVP